MIIWAVMTLYKCILKCWAKIGVEFYFYLHCSSVPKLVSLSAVQFPTANRAGRLCLVPGRQPCCQVAGTFHRSSVTGVLPRPGGLWAQGQGCSGRGRGAAPEPGGEGWRSSWGQCCTKSYCLLPSLGLRTCRAQYSCSAIAVSVVQTEDRHRCQRRAGIAAGSGDGKLSLCPAGNWRDQQTDRNCLISLKSSHS